MGVLGVFHDVQVVGMDISDFFFKSVPNFFFESRTLMGFASHGECSESLWVGPGRSTGVRVYMRTGTLVRGFGRRGAGVVSA